jgi:hypothetical protein
MATVKEIWDNAHAAAANITQQILTTSDEDPGEDNADVQTKLQTLRDKRTLLLLQADQSGSSSADLDKALEAMKAATKSLTDTAQYMKTITGFLNKFNEYVGYADDAIKTAKSVTGPA